jgi:hypothetical protein
MRVAAALFRPIVWMALAAVTPSCAARAPAVEASLPIPAPTVKPFADGREWVLVEPLVFRLGTTGQVITVPAGFVTDFATVPRAFWGMIATFGFHSRAAIVHDYLYWDQGCTREEADGIFLLAMMASHVEAGLRETVYAAVRAAGEESWVANARERRAGQPRVIPAEHLAIPDTVTWRQYRDTLVARGVGADPPSTMRPSYCAAAAAILRHGP